MKFLEKLKGIVEEADLLSLTEEIDKKVNEEKSKLELFYEESNKKVIEEAVASEKAKLEEEYNQKVKDLETELVEKLDLFLESEVNEKIGPELLEQAGKYEAIAPIVEGMQKLFESHYVALDTEGASVIKKKDEELVSKTKELSETISKNMELVKELDESKKKHLISEKTANLSENQTKRVVELFEGKSFAETESKIDSFLGIIKEEKKEESKENINENIDPISKEDKILSEKKEEKIEEPKVETETRMKKILSVAGDLV